MNEMSPTPPSNELVIFGKAYTPAALFVPGAMDPLIEHIRKEVTSEVTDPATPEGRKRIISLAAKVTKSKTTIDGARKDLVADEKKRLAKIDAECRRVWDILDKLAKEVRKPVTEFESREEERVQGHAKAIDAIRALDQFFAVPTTAMLEERLAVAEKVSTDHEEFTALAEAAKRDVVAALTAKVATARQADADHAELERLRADKAKRDKADEAAKIAAKAKAQAEADAQRHKEEVERAAAKEIADAKAEVETAERRAAEAVEEERRRAEEERETEAEAARKREANRAHRAKVNNAVAAGLQAHAGLDEAAAKEVVLAIAKSLIPHTAINY